MHRNKAHCTGRWDDFVLHEGRRERLSRMVKPEVCLIKCRVLW